MIVEVVGIWDQNKGALLMLEAIRDRLKQEYPDIRLAVPDEMNRASRQKLDVLGSLEPFGKQNRLLCLLPDFMLRPVGLVKRSSLRVTLDASGFAYGDFWGQKKLQRRVVERTRRWSGPGKITILLPQALGPFETPGMADTFRQAVDEVDLVFVRDAQSMHYVEETGADTSKIRAAPDFTNLLHPELSENNQHLAGASWVVPNEKVVAAGDADTLTTYIRFLVSAISRIRAEGRDLRILLHEGSKDHAIAEQINAALSDPLPIVDAGGALQTKAVIGAADFILSSRFHALVSALSNGVPAISCGWSHKYEELLKGYDVPQWAVRLDDQDGWLSPVDDVLRASADPAARARLLERADVEKAKSEAMWQNVLTAMADAR